REGPSVRRVDAAALAYEPTQRHHVLPALHPRLLRENHLMTERAYPTSDPAIVAAYRQALTDRIEMSKSIAADVKALGAGPRVFVRDSGFSGISRSITAIEQQGDHIPDGWRVVRGHLEPRRGQPGEAARKWLAEHPPVDLRSVMAAHGHPRSR